VLGVPLELSSFIIQDCQTYTRNPLEHVSSTTSKKLQVVCCVCKKLTLFLALLLFWL